MKNCPTCHATYPADFLLCPRDGMKLADVDPWSEGSVIRGKYQILARIGEGGMGAVFKSLHLRFRELRALKVLKPELARDPLFLKRFEYEAVVARRLQHPNAVRVQDIDETEDGQPFMVMEYIEGTSLKAAIRRERQLPARRALAIASQVASALEAAHQLGMVHRDIKPENVLLVESPYGEVAKVLDFGIAKLRAGVAGTATISLTGSDAIVGTPAYMSPEQAMGRKAGDLDGRSDLYSLGVVMYQMLTGELPIAGDTPLEVMVGHIRTPPRPIREVSHGQRVPDSVADLVMKCLNKKPDQRPASAAALLREIGCCKQVLEEAERREAERAERERLARDRAERERIARETAEAERKAYRQAGQERLARQRAETERRAHEKAEAKRLAREKSEQKCLQRERAQAERRAAEKAQKEQAAREKAEHELQQRQKAEAERSERAKAVQEQRTREKAARERQAREKAEAQRLARERTEQERLARERMKAERRAADRAKRAWAALQKELARRQEEADKPLTDEKAREELRARKKAEAERRAAEIAQKEQAASANAPVKDAFERSRAGLWLSILVVVGLSGVTVWHLHRVRPRAASEAKPANTAPVKEVQPTPVKLDHSLDLPALEHRVVSVSQSSASQADGSGSLTKTQASTRRREPKTRKSADPGLISEDIRSGDALFEKGDYDGAVEAYQRGLSLAPSSQVLKDKIAEAKKAKATEERYGLH